MSTLGMRIGRATSAWFESFEGRRLLSAFVPGELLVQFVPEATDAAITEVRSLLSAGLKERVSEASPRASRHESRHDRSTIDLLSLPDETGIDAAMQRLQGHPAVARVEPNYLFYQAATPNDPSFSQLWGLHNTGQSGGLADADVDGPEAWNITTGSSEVVVFVVDTGIDYTHPDLAANMWRNPFEIPGNGIDDEGNGYVDDVHGINAITGSGNPTDDNGHGTHVAGTIGAVGNNGIGVAGVSWNVKIGSAKFLSAAGPGDTADAIECFNYINDLKQRGVNVLVTNNSWTNMSGYNVSNPFGGGILRDAMDGPAGMEKVLHAVGAGNDSINNDDFVNRPVTWPAAWNLDNIISVAATDRNDRMAGLSSWGATSVDLAAPGVDIYSTLRGGGYGLMSGTSMASPHIAGAAALVFSRYPSLGAEAVKAALMDGADYIGNLGSNASKPTVTNGRLNVHRSLLNLAENDAVAPAAISDLAVAPFALEQATLTWSATGDDGTSGTARLVDIRYSTSAITDEATFALATHAPAEPRPQGASSPATYRVRGMAQNTTYYFAARVVDDVGNASTLSNVASVTTGVGTTVFADGFENGLGQWTAQSPWGLTTSWAASGPYSATHSPSGNYANNADTSLTSLTLDLSGTVNNYASFKTGGSSEFIYDPLRFEVSGNGGAAWTRLASFSGFVTGSAASWIDLSAFDGNNSVQVRFRFQSNSSVTDDGRYLDDVAIVGHTLPPDTLSPTAPTGLAATASTATSISLAWAASSDDRGVVAYDVYRVDPAGYVKVAEATTTSHTVGGLSPSTSYSFYVVARDGAGNASAASSTVTASTSALTVPAAPTGLTATKLSNRRVRLNWADRSDNETGFHLWSSRDGITWTLLTTAAANATSFTTGSLAKGTWHFRVSAFNAAGDSAFSNAVSVLV